MSRCCFVSITDNHPFMNGYERSGCVMNITSLTQRTRIHSVLRKAPSRFVLRCAVLSFGLVKFFVNILNFVLHNVRRNQLCGISSRCFNVFSNESIQKIKEFRSRRINSFIFWPVSLWRSRSKDVWLHTGVNILTLLGPRKLRDN